MSIEAMEQVTEALKSCPFCGEVPQELELNEGSTFRWICVSPSCGCCMKEIRTTVNMEENIKNASEWWNFRGLENERPTKALLIPDLMRQAGWVPMAEMEQAILAEREKCAKLVEGVEAVYFDNKNITGDFFARCIRRRNDK